MLSKDHSSRSSSPPRAWSRRGWIVAGIAMLFGAWGVYCGFWRLQLKRFQVVRPGVLYRMGQPSEFGFDHLIVQHQIKTVLSLQLFDFRLRKDWCDLGKGDGAMETAYVEAQGVRHLQWPMGEEAAWPWLTPWQFEEFFKLLDEPSNFPIAVHCMGGRHRTGTFAALFRLEYDRWDVERTLAEMYSFDFGSSSPMQEHQLRTYLPRPQPNSGEFDALRQAFGPLVSPQEPNNYKTLIYALRQQRTQPELIAALNAYLNDDRPFAIPLAQRLIAVPSEPIVAVAVAAARRALADRDRSTATWSMAAAIVADYGTTEEQSGLLHWLREEMTSVEVSPRYAAIVAGLMNRYTPNRLAYLEPLLNDRRQHVEPAAQAYRYCDTAVARLAAINNQEFFQCQPTRAIWDDAVVTARYWFEHHPEARQLTTLLPATGRNSVRVGTGYEVEDLSRQLK